MKHIMKYGIKAGLAAVVMLFSSTSCNDFLDIEPLSDIVAENYWTEKSDVENAVYGCYSGLSLSGCLTRMFAWGEMRSDNITFSTSTPLEIRQILSENILETNGVVNWVNFYQVINRCNTVITYAPEVTAKDPNYSDAEMRAHVAEATWLRSLCYFYLLRTFRDVPYSTRPSLNDKEIDGDYRIAPMNYDALLSQLISDVEAVKNDALKLYPTDRTIRDPKAANTSRVTVCAMYALLADLYLWQGDFANCIANCDQVMAYKMERYEELREESPEEAIYISLMDDRFPLLLDQVSGNRVGDAYNSIFGTGNSFESIFELYFEEGQSTENAMVNDFFGSRNTPVGSCAAYSELMTGVYENTGTTFRATDYRVAEAIATQGSQYAIRKYLVESVYIQPSRVSGTAPAVSYTMRSTNYANWIIYRLTDVMLMKAEALAELGGTENLDEAFAIVSAIYNRGNNLTPGNNDCLKRDDYGTQPLMQRLVLDERHRELLFEGKRWYDLVRFSLRIGNNMTLLEAVVGKQREKQSAVRVKLSSKDALFWPYFKSEMDANPNLTQNAAYITNETSKK